MTAEYSELRDLEGGGGRGSPVVASGLKTNLRRKWNTIPRILRFYLLLGSIFLVAFIFAYSYLAANTPKLEDEKGFEDRLVGEKIHHYNSNNNNQKNQPLAKPNLPQKRPPSADNEIGDDDRSDNEDNNNNNDDEEKKKKKAVDPDPLLLLPPSGPVPLLTSADFKAAASRQSAMQRRIQAAIANSWAAYRRSAWGYDHLKPISRTGHNWFHIGLTILDSLDTLQMAGLEKEYKEGIDWVKNDLSFEIYQEVNCFETTIRALGGLLSAYHLARGDDEADQSSSSAVLLEKATDLGGRLVHCFDSPSRTVPFSDVNLKTRAPKAPRWSTDSSLSEVASMQLEMRDLSRETGTKLFEEKSFATTKHIHELVQSRADPLLPMYISPITGQLTNAVVTMGARADSYYEYLFKQYLQLNQESKDTGEGEDASFLLDDYLAAVAAIKGRLMRRTKGHLGLAYIGELFPSRKDVVSPKMDHLVCFFSGTLALGYYHHQKAGFGLRKSQGGEAEDAGMFRGHPVVAADQLASANISSAVFADHLAMAEDLARTCHYMYNLTETGLSPEIAYYGTLPDEKEFTVRPADTHNLLRPEFVESLFFLYHITGKPLYREWGRQVFEAFERYSKVGGLNGGYTTVNDVRNPKNVRPKDMMESFWIAETLKYLYLLFLDDRAIVDSLLANYVFNTEGHLVLRRGGAVH
ncbi:Endoplasmic reticulum mannosyl-oligosaccharide 1,2-alpha-mannosidase [Tyrophagus putrescentiae]|nr:Endoplasmic reticulum mannosyl-oligosaccharide 1,2-alpha-mannosidase [Tyrophagus putrescentiae]